MNNQDVINFLKERKAYHEEAQVHLLEELATARKNPSILSKKGREYLVRDIENEQAVSFELGHIISVLEAQNEK